MNVASAFDRLLLQFDKSQKQIAVLAATALIAIAVVPIWTVRFPPLQDYPLHVLRANIIAHYHDAASRYANTFVVSLAPIPYILTDYLISGLACLIPTLIAGKVALTIYVILFPVSFFYLVDSIDPNKLILGFSSFLLIHNRFLEKGNTSYFFSFPLFLFTLGYWWRHRIGLTLQQKVSLSALVFAVYLCHLYTFLFLVFSIVILAGFEFRSVSKTLRTLLPVLPSVLFLCISVTSEVAQIRSGSTGISTDPVVVEYPGLRAKLLAVSNVKFEMPYLMTFSPRRERRTYVAAFALFALLGLGSLRAQFNIPFLWLFLALCALYFLLPQGFSPGYDVAPRTLIFILLIIPLCVALPSSPAFRFVVACLLVLLSLYSLQGSWKDYASAGSNLDDLDAELQRIPGDERVAFRTSASDMYFGKITPYALFGAYYYLGRGAPRAGDIGTEMSAILRSVDVRHISPPPSSLESVLARDVGPGGYAIVLEGNQRSRVHYLAEKYGFHTVAETRHIAVFRRVRNVAGPNWFAGPYYSVGAKVNYNYLLIFQNSLDEPDISKQFELVSSRGRAHLWRRRHFLADGSPAELCIPCGDQP